MNIGIRAHDLGSFTSAADLAAAVKSAGLNSVQLVAWKCFDRVSRSPSIWTADLVKEIRRELVDAGIQIPLAGAYFNWYSKEELAGGGDGRRIFRESLAAARSMGASTVGTEIEGYARLPLRNPGKNRREAAMEHAVSIATELQVTAVEADAFIGIEGVWWHVLDTPERVRELKDRSGADRIRFIFDPVNFLNARNWRKQREIIDRAIELYGDNLVLVHCKDFMPTPAGLIPVSPGKGRFDYPYLVQRLREAKLEDVPLILEGVTGKNISRSTEYLRNLAGS